MAQLAIQYREGGVWLPEARLWLDPHQTQTGPEPVFVSHAHADHARRHREVIVTEPTSLLMKARLGGKREEQILAYGARHRVELADVETYITLLPAGHILGSAMARVDTSAGSLLYTGDFKLRHGLCADPFEPSPAHRSDVLIMETTYGRPAYRFPPAATVRKEIARFCRQSLEEELTPVLLAYSLGKSQEVLSALAGEGFPIMLHDSVWDITEVYRKCGIEFPPHARLDKKRVGGQVLICPPQTARAPWLQALGNTRKAIVTGWAMDPSCRFQYGADAAFALSDHADYDELMEMVRRIQPAKVLTLHGFAADFARAVRQLGIEARALSEHEQLWLDL